MTPSSAPDSAVLLVDDRPENLRAFEAVLAPLETGLGVRLLQATDAQEALRHVLAEGDAIAVILLDVMMPGTDGLATARLIRARRATEHVPIIFVTALDADRRRVTEGYLSGAVDYLTKPIEADVLRAKVRAFVHLHRRRADAALAERRRFADRIAETESVARASDARLRAVLDSLPDAVGVFDAAWRWSYANPAMGELLRRQGHDPDAALGRVLWEQMPELRDTRFAGALRRARATGAVVEYEEHLAALDAWYEQRIVPGRDETTTVYSRDVSARYAAEAARLASEARLRPMMESGIVGVFFWELAGGITEANDAFLAMLGYTRADLAAGRVDWRGMTPAEFAAADAEKVAELLATGAHGPYEKAYVARDGRPVPVLIASALVGDGRARGVSVCIDLTERRRAEAERARALRDEAAVVDTVQRIGTALAAELELERLVQAVTDAATALAGAQFGAFFYSVDDRARGESLALYALSGASREHFARFPHPRATPVFGPTFRGEGVVRSDDITADPRYGRMAPHHGMPAGHLPVRSYLAVPVRSRTGEVLGGLFFGHEAAGVFGERAERLVVGVAGWAAVAMDNARLYAAERQAAADARLLQQVTAALGAVVTREAVVDALLEHGVPALGAATGLVMLRSADGAALERAGARGYPADFPNIFDRIPLDAGFPVAAAVRDAAPVWVESREEAAQRHPGLARVYDAGGYRATAALPLADGAGRVFGALAFNFATPRRFSPDARAVFEALARQCAQALERARLFAAEREARAEAERSSHAKGEFLAVMSHELRTPLNAIAGYAELLEIGIHGPVTPEQRTALGRIQRSQRHLLGLINEVLNYARLESGAVTYDLRPTLVADVVAAVAPLVEPQRAAKAIALETRLPERAPPGAEGHAPAPVHVLADPEKLQQILLNLLSNAIKFTADGGRVAVTLDATPDAEGRAVLRVSDTGIGIPADKLEAIFEPFVQVRADLTRPQEGTGLGLAISRDLARGMGGDLTAESTPGVGSTFRLVLSTA